jgi:hypothetical protein
MATYFDPFSDVQSNSEGEKGWYGPLDFAKDVGANSLSAVSQPFFEGQYAGDQSESPWGKVSGDLGMALHTGAENLRGYRSAAAKDTEEHPLNHPLGAIAQGVAGIPAFVGETAALAPVLGPAAPFAAGAQMQVGSMLESALSGMDSMNDQELAQRFPVYGSMLQSNMEQMSPRQASEAARRDFEKVLVSNKDLLLQGLVGAATGGAFGHIMKGVAPGLGRLGNAALGGAEGAASMGGMTAAGDYQQQEANVRGGAQQGIDYDSIINDTLKSAGLGAAIGGGFGAFHGKGKDPVVRLDSEKAPDPAETAALTGTTVEQEGVPLKVTDEQQAALDASLNPGAEPDLSHLTPEHVDQLGAIGINPHDMAKMSPEDADQMINDHASELGNEAPRGERQPALDHLFPEQIEELRKIGYSDQDIEKMSPSEAHRAMLDDTAPQEQQAQAEPEQEREPNLSHLDPEVVNELGAIGISPYDMERMSPAEADRMIVEHSEPGETYSMNPEDFTSKGNRTAPAPLPDGAGPKTRDLLERIKAKAEEKPAESAPEPAPAPTTVATLPKADDLFSVAPKKQAKERLPAGVPSTMREEAVALRSALASKDKIAILRAEGAFREKLPLVEAKAAIKAIRDKFDKEQPSKSKADLVRAAASFAEAVRNGNDEGRAKAEAELRKVLGSNANEVIGALEKGARGEKLSPFETQQMASFLGKKTGGEKAKPFVERKKRTKPLEDMTVDELKKAQAKDDATDMVRQSNTVNVDFNAMSGNEEEGAKTKDAPPEIATTTKPRSKPELYNPENATPGPVRKPKLSAEDEKRLAAVKPKAEAPKRSAASSKEVAEDRKIGEAEARRKSLDERVLDVYQKTIEVAKEKGLAPKLAERQARVAAEKFRREAKLEKGSENEPNLLEINDQMKGDLFGWADENQPVKESRAAVAQEGPEYQAAIENKPLSGVADHIAKTSTNPSYRVIAERVRDRILELEAIGAKFGLLNIVRPNTSHPSNIVNALANGRGVATTNFFKGSLTDTTVSLNSHDYSASNKHGTDHHVTLHELLHAVTNAALRIGQLTPGSELHKHYVAFKELHSEVVREFNRRVALSKLGKYELTPFEKEILADKNNALSNDANGNGAPLRELLAWGMSNPEMQDFLRSIKTKGQTNIFTKFVETVRNLLGVKPGEANALSDLIHLTDRVTSFDPEELRQAGTELGIKSGAIKSPLNDAMRVGDFTPQGNAREQNDLGSTFREPLRDALKRNADTVKSGADTLMEKVRNPVETMTNMARDVARNAKSGTMLSRIGNALETNDQFRQRKEKLIPQIRSIFDNVERMGVHAQKLKQEGSDIEAALWRAQKMDPKGFEAFSDFIHDQTMYGVDASEELGKGFNEHLDTNAYIRARERNGRSKEDLASEHAINTWEARAAYPGLKAKYAELVARNPDYAKLQKSLFKFYDKSHSEMSKGILDSILRTYGYAGDRKAVAKDLFKNGLTDKLREHLNTELGSNAVAQIEAVDNFRKVDGPYAPLMRRGDHVVIGEYKLPEGKGALARPEKNQYEFRTRAEAEKFATSQPLKFKAETVYYDPLTGKRSTKEGAISTAGGPEKRILVTLQEKHLEFHETAADARRSYEELKGTNQFDTLNHGERRQYADQEEEFTGRGVARLINSIQQQDAYKKSSESDREVFRNAIKEAGIRAMSGNRVQSRRLPRRRVEGASKDLLRNLYDYNNSASNYRAKLAYDDVINSNLEDMWKHVEGRRHSADYADMSAAANETERRARSQDPNTYTGKYTDWSRRLMMYSYIDRMMRPSHLILHQTHLPMITVPYMVGRHGFGAFGTMLKAWKEATGAYRAGGEDFVKSISDSLHKGTNYNDLFKESFKDAPDAKRLGQMFDAFSEIGLLHPESGIELQKYMPSTQKGGLVGALDAGLGKFDTVFRHLTNATEAINRYVGATAAYRLEFEKLTRAGKGQAEAHAGAMEYARNVIANTQGVYSATNAAPLFKNKFLKPFMQFRQFPQMIYNLLGKTMVQAFKGETREAKVQAVASLAAVLGMHTMMTGVLGGLPLEAFKIAGTVSKGLGLTDGDWSDVEQGLSEYLYKSMGKDAAELILHGLGRQAGVDVHHRLGLNSFFTFGMPDKLDSQSVYAFIAKAALGAPAGLVEDTLKGVNQMANGDIVGGMEKAFPLQILRDVERAWSGGSQQADSYAYGVGDKAARLLGFTPAGEAEYYEKKNETYHLTQGYNQKRTELMQSWEKAKPEHRDDMWAHIQQWNADKPKEAQITKGELIKSLGRRSKQERVNGIPVNKRNRYLLESAQNLS